MSSLVIEGDPGAIRTLHDELIRRVYLGPEFTVGVVEYNALAVSDLVAACKRGRAPLSGPTLLDGVADTLEAYGHNHEPSWLREKAELERAAIAKAEEAV